LLKEKLADLFHQIKEISEEDILLVWQPNPLGSGCTHSNTRASFQGLREAYGSRTKIHLHHVKIDHSRTNSLLACEREKGAVLDQDDQAVKDNITRWIREIGVHIVMNQDRLVECVFRCS
jgi:hypothetical protein